MKIYETYDGEQSKVAITPHIKNVAYEGKAGCKLSIHLDIDLLAPAYIDALYLVPELLEKISDIELEQEAH